MKLRYTVETQKSPAFTASKRVDDALTAFQYVCRLKYKMTRNPYVHYSDFILYDDENNVMQKWR